MKAKNAKRPRDTSSEEDKSPEFEINVTKNYEKEANVTEIKEVTPVFAIFKDLEEAKAVESLKALSELIESNEEITWAREISQDIETASHIALFARLESLAGLKLSEDFMKTCSNLKRRKEPFVVVTEQKERCEKAFESAFAESVSEVDEESFSRRTVIKETLEGSFNREKAIAATTIIMRNAFYNMLTNSTKLEKLSYKKKAATIIKELGKLEKWTNDVTEVHLSADLFRQPFTLHTINKSVRSYASNTKAYTVEKILENKYDIEPIHILHIQKPEKYYILYTEEQNYTSHKKYTKKEHEGYKIYMKHSKKHGKQDEGNQKEVIEKYFELNGFGLMTLTKLLKIATDKKQITPNIKTQVQEKCDTILTKIQSIEDVLVESGYKIGQDFVEYKEKFQKQSAQSLNIKKQAPPPKKQLSDSEDSDSKNKRKPKHPKNKESDDDRERKRGGKAKPTRDDSDSEEERGKAKKGAKPKSKRNASLSNSSEDDRDQPSKPIKKTNSKKARKDSSSEEEVRKPKASQNKGKARPKSSDEESDDEPKRGKAKAAKEENVNKKSSSKIMKCVFCNKEDNENRLLSMSGDSHNIHRACLNKLAKDTLPKFSNFEDIKCPNCGKQIDHNLLEKQLDKELFQKLDALAVQNFIM